MLALKNFYCNLVLRNLVGLVKGSCYGKDPDQKLSQKSYPDPKKITNRQHWIQHYKNKVDAYV